MRPLRGRSIVDLGFLIEHVARRLKPLDTNGVMKAASPLTVWRPTWKRHR
jgi:hypothetical protein